ncbi:aldolase/citrate lyase family protein [Gordonia sp. CPCC 205515]|uniref:HpcH/HpaI aldolase family protein n=1 Tax=Gordonia sp. CPCC 205515 TaxID=3140791 RepID=UPI003AF33F10
MTGSRSVGRVTLKARAAAGEQLVGALLRMPSEELVEMAAVAGLDYVLIDCEHGSADETSLRHHITVAQLHGMDTLVRVGQHEPALIQRALDLGATGIVVPHVDSAEQAAAAVFATRYPPLGDRGFATYGRTGRFGSVTAREHLDADVDGTLTIAMIESRAGCENAAEILAVPGLDGALCGPSDLAVSMGLDSTSDPSLVATIAEVHEHVAQGGAIRMDIVGNLDRVRDSFAAGAGMVVVNLTSMLMAMFGDLAAVSRRR